MPELYQEHDESEVIVPIAIPDSMPNLQNLDAELERRIEAIVDRKLHEAFSKLMRQGGIRESGWPHLEHKGAH